MSEHKPGALMVRVRLSQDEKIGIKDKDWNYEFTIFEWRSMDPIFGANLYDWHMVHTRYIDDPCFRDHIKGEQRATELGIARLKRAIQHRDGKISFEKRQKASTKQFYEGSNSDVIWEFHSLE